MQSPEKHQQQIHPVRSPKRGLLRLLMDQERWPTGWKLGEHRCRGLSTFNVQCTRRTREGDELCYAHSDQEAATVKARVAELEEQVRSEPDTPLAQGPGTR